MFLQVIYSIPEYNKLVEVYSIQELNTFSGNHSILFSVFKHLPGWESSLAGSGFAFLAFGMPMPL